MSGSEIDAVLAFWQNAGAKAWFSKSDAFDAQIEQRFGAVHRAAASGAHDDWAATAKGALALIIVLDQFSRNLFRDDPRAFAQDEKAREIAHSAIANGFDDEIAKTFDPKLRSFFYMPFMHGEDIDCQDFCVACFSRIGDEDGLKHANIHRDIIQRFGRFPHRNPTLARETTPAEQAFLDSGGFKG